MALAFGVSNTNIIHHSSLWGALSSCRELSETEKRNWTEKQRNCFTDPEDPSTRKRTKILKKRDSKCMIFVHCLYFFFFFFFFQNNFVWSIMVLPRKWICEFNLVCTMSLCSLKFSIFLQAVCLDSYNYGTLGRLKTPVALARQFSVSSLRHSENRVWSRNSLVDPLWLFVGSVDGSQPRNVGYEADVFVFYCSILHCILHGIMHCWLAMVSRVCLSVDCTENVLLSGLNCLFLDWVGIPVPEPKNEGPGFVSAFQRGHRGYRITQY